MFNVFQAENHLDIEIKWVGTRTKCFIVFTRQFGLSDWIKMPVLFIFFLFIYMYLFSYWVIPEKNTHTPTDGELEILTGGGFDSLGNPGMRQPCSQGLSSYRPIERARRDSGTCWSHATLTIKNIREGSSVIRQLVAGWASSNSKYRTVLRPTLPKMVNNTWPSG